MEYICDFLGNNYIMFDTGKKKFRLQERGNYDSDIIQVSNKERKKFAMKVILGNEGRLIREFISNSSMYSDDLFKVRVSFSLDDLVTLDDRPEDCVMLDISLRCVSNFKNSVYNLNLDAYFYCSDNSHIVGSREYDFHLTYKHKCPLELIWSLLNTVNDSEEEYLSIYLDFLGGDETDIIKTIVNNGAFLDSNLVDISGLNHIDNNKILEFFSFNSRLLFNDNGSVCSCTIMNSNDDIDDC